MVDYSILSGQILKITIVTVCISLSYLGSQISYCQDGNQTSPSIGTWKTHNNELVGFSFDYPSNWNVEEKENRFDSTAADAAVTGDGIRFSVRKAIDRPEDNPLRSSGLLATTKLIEQGASQSGNIIIEQADVKKYKIGGERAGSFLAKIDDGISTPRGMQTFMVFHDGDAYMMNFQAPTERFDSPETQNIMNKILQSFIFSNNG